MTPIFYNAHHSPIGAFCSLTLGQEGPMGGLGLELSGPANEPLHIGLETLEGGSYRALPFFAYRTERAEDYDVEGLAEFTRPQKVTAFGPDEITRKMGPSIDRWVAGDLTFRLISPITSIPEPDSDRDAELKKAIRPAVLAEMVVDNSKGTLPRRAYFGYAGGERSAGMRVVHLENGIGVAQHTMTGIATDDPTARGGIAFQPERILEPDAEENLPFLVGNLGLVVVTVAPGEVRRIRFAVGFFREGTATTGVTTRYLYRRFYDDLESVLSEALADFDDTVQLAERFDADFAQDLGAERHWQLSHAIRSYYGCTQLLEREDGTPLWVVNEGEYRMMNTLDLTVDQTFFELAQNPWTVRNVLDLFAERYAYEDEVRAPGSSQALPGGLAFTHDMGVSNAFARPGYSGYEQAKLRGCFSYMSAEELMNWVLTAGMYQNYTRDLAWAVSHRGTILAALQSMANRDNPVDELRNGVVGHDADRCRGGAEITTYDSLDASLGQARNNLYLAVKGWATYLLLESMLRGLGEVAAADLASRQASRAVQTILASRDEEGLFPAIIGEGVEARIIPAIEALVYPFVLGLPIDPELKAALDRHFDLVLQPGICLFPDGGWKLSSTSRNSWLSKIYLCQFVAERILGRPGSKDADRAHVGWLLDPGNAYFAWSDQMLAGKAVGSRYYPRGVTAILWLAGGEQPLDDLERALRGAGVPA